jgi:hypothetical protein
LPWQNIEIVDPPQEGVDTIADAADAGGAHNNRG